MQITNPENIKRFITGGKATFTVTSKKTGARFTYRVRTANEDQGTFFVSVLTGSNNEENYSYAGMFSPDREFWRTQNSKIGEDAKSVLAFGWLIKALKADSIESLEFHHAGRCARCNRLLTDPESIESGFGPVCRAA